MDMTIMGNKNINSGFTLIELSIVLVIMGLLTSAVVAGRELIKAAEIKATISEIETYKIAVDNFNNHYEGLPGDLNNATSFWTGGVTANGNNDGRIGNGNASDDTEPYYAWDQLSLARLIGGSFTGAGTSAVVGTNVPESGNMKGAGYSLSFFTAPFSYADNLGRSFRGNYIVLGKGNGSDNYLSAAAINVDTAFSIDRKVDDGTPDYGKVLGGTGGNGSGSCVTGSAPAIEYNTTNNGMACIILFAIQ